MGICDELKNWDAPGQGYADRLQAIRDWISEESEEWGVEKPSVVVGKSVDENGDEHWSSYDRDTNTITMDPDLFRDTDTYSSTDVYNSAAHEFRHAMQDQYDELDEDDSEEDMSSEDREQDADDFAETYESMWEGECGDGENDSAPGDDLGDWELDEGDMEEEGGDDTPRVPRSEIPPEDFA